MDLWLTPIVDTYMRDIQTIDAELRLMARAWRVAREMTGHTQSTVYIDQLLDERASAVGPATVGCC